MEEKTTFAHQTSPTKASPEIQHLPRLPNQEIQARLAEDCSFLLYAAASQVVYQKLPDKVLSATIIFFTAVAWGKGHISDMAAPAAISNFAATIDTRGPDETNEASAKSLSSAITLSIPPPTEDEPGLSRQISDVRLSSNVNDALKTCLNQVKKEDRQITATDLMLTLFGAEDSPGFQSKDFRSLLVDAGLALAEVATALQVEQPAEDEAEKTEETEAESEASGDSDRRDAAAEVQERHQTELASDRAETTRDLLGRAPLAFTLARHVNRIWTEQNKPTTDDDKQAPDEAAFILHIDSPWGGGKTTFANYLSRILNPQAYDLDPNASGKDDESLFAELSMEDEDSWPKAYADQKWITVPFNAWQNQHVSPPWWNYYEAIRRQCLSALPRRERIKDWFKEWAWRIWSPDFQRTLFVVAVVLVIAWPLMSLGVLNPTGKAVAPKKAETEQSEVAKVKAKPAENVPSKPAAKTPSQQSTASQPKQATNGRPQPAAASSQPGAGDVVAKGTNTQPETPAGSDTLKTILVLVLTGGSGFALLKSFKSGLSRIIDSAATSVDPGTLGEADPIRRFRKRFAKAMQDYKQPVLVVVDDLDRCEPDYVVELIRGMLTIFRSPRVVFVLLGDKSWIETSFANVHEDMAAAHTDDEISFGERFAEKAIQLSFILPEPDEASREAYIDHLLLGEDAGKAPVAKVPSGHDGDATPGTSVLSQAEQEELHWKAEHFKEQTRGKLRATGSGEDRNKVTDEQHRAARDLFGVSEEMRRLVETMVNREAALQVAISEHTDKEIRHGVSVLKSDLPDNPRRIKRIINMIAAYQAGAQTVHGVKPLSDQWRQLVLWIILMSEHPEAWRILSANPDFADLIIKGKTVKTAKDQKSDADGPSKTELFATVSHDRIARLIKGESFKDPNVRIDTEAVGWLSRLTPMA